MSDEILVVYLVAPSTGHDNNDPARAAQADFFDLMRKQDLLDTALPS